MQLLLSGKSACRFPESDHQPQHLTPMLKNPLVLISQSYISNQEDDDMRPEATGVRIQMDNLPFNLKEQY